jgi:hypothetical protein
MRPTRGTLIASECQDYSVNNLKFVQKSQTFAQDRSWKAGKKYGLGFDWRWFLVCEQTSCDDSIEMWIADCKVVFSPCGNKSFGVIGAIQRSDKQVTYGLGELRYYGTVSNGKDQGH